jgi:hypothetical protein
MAIIARDRVQTIHNNIVTANTTDVESSPAIPLGQVWQISRIIFADQGINDGLSGGFQVDFGTGGSREIILAAYLLGNTIAININRTFTGDGINVFRYIRENISPTDKKMFIMVEGFKRIGDL